MYRPVAPVYTRFLDRSISVSQSVSRNSEGHMESVQPIKCMLFILICNKYISIQLTLVISNSMGPWKKFESTVVRLKRSYEDTGSVDCLTTKGRQLERNFEELKPASHVPILGTILNIFNVFVALFFSPLNSLNLVKRLITSRYLFLCE